MPLDWLVDPGVPAALERQAVVELWPLDVSPVTGAAAKDQTWPLLANGTPVRLCLSEDQVIKAWREERAKGGRYFEVRLGEHIVKAVHLPDCCSCQRCNPSWHGQPPKLQGPGIPYDDRGWCLCHRGPGRWWEAPSARRR